MYLRVFVYVLHAFGIVESPLIDALIERIGKSYRYKPLDQHRWGGWQAVGWSDNRCGNQACVMLLSATCEHATMPQNAQPGKQSQIAAHATELNCNQFKFAVENIIRNLLQNSLFVIRYLCDCV